MKLHHLWLGLLIWPAAMFSENLSGIYHVHGYDPSSIPPEYEGYVTIQSYEATAVAPDTHPDDYYIIHWTYSDFQSITGQGVRKDDYIAFEFTGDTDPTYTGVQLYKIKEYKEKDCHHDLSLKGPWVVKTDTYIGQEKLSRIN